MISHRKKRSRLVIIHHAREAGLNHHRHLIASIVPRLEANGMEVVQVFGTAQAPEAEVALLHVDLSVVPQEYLELARKYPAALNGKISDIRKSRLSLLRVEAAPDYAGSVIVKSSLNYAGLPEFAQRDTWQKSRRLANRLMGSFSPFQPPSKADYRIYSSPAEVPDSIWKSRDLIVEKFRPEIHDGRYCLREWYFCGDQDFQRVELSTNPVFTIGTLVTHLDLPVPEKLRELRVKLGFDYGKFDYTVVDGEAVVFDFNKTIGVFDPQNKVVQALGEKLGWGLESYFR